MPTLVELLAQISFLAAMPSVVGVLITAEILVVSREWRLNAMALAAQYFFVVLLLSRLVRLEVAAIKGLIGWMICLVFYLTEQRTRSLEQSSDAESTTSQRRWRRWVLSARASFFLLAGIMVAVAVYTAASHFPLTETEVPPDIMLASYLLVGLGLLTIGLSESPMQVGAGLLTFLTGFDLFYVALEPSLAVTGLLGAVSFLIALAAAYLRTAQATVSKVGEEL